MLNELVEYARKNSLSTPSGFKSKTSKWTVVLSDNGRFVSVDRDDKTFSMCPDLTFSELIAGGVTRSQFLLETVGIACGLSAKKRDADKHSFFISLMKEAGRYDPRFKLCARLLEDPGEKQKLNAALAAQKAKPIDKINFKVGDTYLIETEGWHEWWQEYRQSLTNETGEIQRMRCLVSGELVAPVSTHFKIMGLTSVGGQPAGSVLIGFDKASFTSYGLEQSRNAACSEQAAVTYRNAFEHLVKKAPKPIAGALFLHWYKEPLEPADDLFDYSVFGAVNENDAVAQATRIINAAREGNYPQYLNNRYYILQISDLFPLNWTLRS